MFDDLTLQQFCALDYNRNMVVTAGPGAGKTRVLSQRYCFILLTEPEVSVSQILTLTFTEKAAEEMKTRIYESLIQLDNHANSGANESLQHRIREIKNQFQRNRISTIHSFCAGLLRDHPVESGIDPNFKVIEGARQRGLMEDAIDACLSSTWRNNRDLVSTLLKSFGNSGRLKRAIHKLIEHPLVFDRVHSTMQTLFGIEKWYHGAFREYCRLIMDSVLFPYLQGLRVLEKKVGQYSELIELLEEWHSGVDENQEDFGIPELFRKMRSLAEERKPGSSMLYIEEGLNRISYVDMIDEYFPDIFFGNSPDKIFEMELNQLTEIAKTCFRRYQIEKEKINALDFADLESITHRFLSDLFREKDHEQIRRIQGRFRHIMVDEFQDTNSFQWDIISWLCSDKKGDSYALQPNKLFVVGDKRQSIYRFRGGDVTVFESVLKEITQSNPAFPQKMFWEDDRMNDCLASISDKYDEIREIHSRGFDSLADKEKSDILNGDVYLPHNFRTAPDPIDFFNRTFEKVFGNKGAGNLEPYETRPREIISPQEKNRFTRSKGSVSVYLTPSGLDRKDIHESEASLLVDIIDGILGKKGKDDYAYNAFPDIRHEIENNRPGIGILFFSFNHIKTFENIFREAKLPFVLHRGKGFYRCPEVIEIIQILNYLTDERQSINLLSALRGPMFGMKDSEIFDLFYDKEININLFIDSENSYIREVGRQIRSWRFLAGRLTISELIRRIISDRSLTAIHSAHTNGKQRLANIEKLIENARQFQREEGSIHDFVEYCLEMADEEEKEGEAIIVTGEGSPITMMTIHSAKGLEFPMVMIPNLDRRLPFRPETGRSVRFDGSIIGRQQIENRFSGELPIWEVEIPKLGYVKKYSPLGKLLIRKNKLEEVAENRRIFYVACTRAKNHLILIGSMKKALMNSKKPVLTSQDYRERASILELLDDIYDLNGDLPITERNSRGHPSIIWCDRVENEYKGITYEKERIDKTAFGVYNDKVRKMDLSDRIIQPLYLQLSFKSISVFRKCPVRFYFEVVLGIRPDGLPIEDPLKETIDGKAPLFEETDEPAYNTEGALVLGSIIHRYLERHRFGDPLDRELLMNIIEGFEPTDHDDKDNHQFDINALREIALIQLLNTTNDEQLIRIMNDAERYHELPFVFNVTKDIEFRGVIDCLLRKKNIEDWIIIDWKSNETGSKDPEQIALENDYFLQLDCYRWAVEHILKKRVGKLLLYFTNGCHLIEGRSSDNPEQVIMEIKNRVVEYSTNWDLLKNDYKRMKDKDMRCEYCEYNERICK